MQVADEGLSPGLILWAALLVICGVSWFVTLYAVLPGYSYAMAWFLYGDSLLPVLLLMLLGVSLFILVDVVLPALVLAAVVVAVKVPEGRRRLFAGGLGLSLRLLTLLHSLGLLAVVATVFYLKFVVNFGGTWPWLTFTACLLGWSATFFCWHFLLSCSRREG